MAPTEPLAWEPPYAEGVVLKRPQKKKKDYSYKSIILDGNSNYFVARGAGSSSTSNTFPNSLLSFSLGAW